MIETESAINKLNRHVAKVILETQNDPLGHVMQMYPWGVPGKPLEHVRPRAWQVRVMEGIRHAMEAGFSKVFVDISSGHGIGKSALIAWLNIWMLLSFHTKGIITANTGNQLATKTMPELNKWFSLSIASHWMSYHATSLRRNVGGRGNDSKYEDWRIDATPWVKEKPDAFGGLHNAHGRVCVTFDEASGIHKVIWETIDGAMSDSDSFMLWIRAGNPLRNVGAFADLFRHKPIGGVVHTIRENIDSREVEGTDVAYINAKIEENGGEDSDYAKSRWRGIFPDQSDWQFIDSKDVDAAMLREPRSILTDPICAGIDFARSGPDDTVLRFRKGFDAKSFPSYRWDNTVGKNSMQLASQISMRLNEVKPHYIMADNGGIGGPIIDKLRELGHNVIAIDAGGAPSSQQDRLEYKNVRGVMWKRYRDWLKEGGALPKEPKLREQTIQQEFFFRPDNNQIMLVSKEDMAAEGLKSPDEVEALIQTFGVIVAPLNDPLQGGGRVLPERGSRGYDPHAGL